MTPFLLASVVSLGVLGCASGDDTSSADAPLTDVVLQPLPAPSADDAWLECDDGTMALNVFDRRAPDGRGWVTSANLLLGANVHTGVVDDAGHANLTGASGSFVGDAVVDYPGATVKLKGLLVLGGDVYPVAKTLVCVSLGRSYNGSAPPPPPPADSHGDSAWLVCDSATLVANILEHRNAAGDGRAVTVSIIVGGDRLLSGDVAARGMTTLSGDGGSLKATVVVDSYDGESSVTFTAGALSLDGASFAVDPGKIPCRRLDADL